MINTENEILIGRVKNIKNNKITIDFPKSNTPKIIINVASYCELKKNDIIYLDQEKRAHILWRVKHKDNSLFIADQCNQRCIFCPQNLSENAPESEETLFYREVLKFLRTEDLEYVTITGGEPTLDHKELIEVISQLLKINQEAKISVLSNGMIFDDCSVAKKVSDTGKTNVKLCISLHADTPSLHDAITTVRGSFERTVMGILNLQRYGASTELRIVMNKINANRLDRIAFFIGSNFPFVAHVAFMGLELFFKAAANAKNVWIDPIEYSENLDMAVYILSCYGIPVSIYNLPYCLVKRSSWQYLRDSISEWKKTYLKICDDCVIKATCPGLFRTSVFQSGSITPIREI